MAHQRRTVRRMKVTAEAIIEITDEAALELAVLADIDATDFQASDDSPAEQVRASEREQVAGDPTAALSWIADPFAIVPDLQGIDICEGASSVAEIDQYGATRLPLPDFAALFPVCSCAKDSCQACSGFQITPRTAAVLWAVGQILADQAYDDIEDYGDDPVADDNNWAVFGRYPRLTWTQNAVWRRQAARAYDDLAADLLAGHWPTPRSPAEEMALHLILRDAPAAVDDNWAGLGDDTPLPTHTDDFAWDLALDALFQDTDILTLFNPQLDGIEDPHADLNLQFSIGDYRPQAWFQVFANMRPRDGRRPFRR